MGPEEEATEKEFCKRMEEILKAVTTRNLQISTKKCQEKVKAAVLDIRRKVDADEFKSFEDFEVCTETTQADLTVECSKLGPASADVVNDLQSSLKAEESKMRLKFELDEVLIKAREDKLEAARQHAELLKNFENEKQKAMETNQKMQEQLELQQGMVAAAEGRIAEQTARLEEFKKEAAREVQELKDAKDFEMAALREEMNQKHAKNMDEVEKAHTQTHKLTGKHTCAHTCTHANTQM